MPQPTGTPSASAARYAKLPEALLRDPNISAGAKLTYAVLHRHGTTPEDCHPSRARIAEWLGASVGSVKRWLTELVAYGWIERVPRTSTRGHPDTNGYRLFGLASSGVTDGPTPRGVGSQVNRGGVTHEPGVGSQVNRGWGHTRAAKESHRTRASEREDPPTPLPAQQPLLPEPGRVVAMATRPAANGNGSHDLAFDAFWQAYPRKVGKPKARQAWDRALRRASDAAIIEGAHRYAADPNREDKYTAHPTTWLNRDGWDDPPLPGGRGNRTDRALARLGVGQPDPAALFTNGSHGGSQPARAPGSVLSLPAARQAPGGTSA